MIPTVSLSFPNLLLLIFLVMLVATIVFSCVLIYHWCAYGESKAITTTTTLVYLIGVVGLLGGMGTAILMTF